MKKTLVCLIALVAVGVMTALAHGQTATVTPQASAASNIFASTECEPANIIILHYVVAGAVNFSEGGYNYTFTKHPVEHASPGLIEYHVRISNSKGDIFFTVSDYEKDHIRHIDIAPNVE